MKPIDLSLLADAHQRAGHYLQGLEQRPVPAAAEAVASLSELQGPLSAAGRPAADVLRELDEYGSPATMAMAGGRFFGFVIGGALPVTVAANWLATAWDQNTAKFEVTPAAAALENIALEWLVALFDLPAGSGGAFVTGATVANLVALAAARQAVLEAAGWDVEADGLIGAPPVTLIGSAEMHPSVRKSLGVLGLGRERVVEVPVDAQGRMRADRLPKHQGPTIICTQVGNVNTGASDPVAAICEQSQGGHTWVHVDGAFGLWAKTSANTRDQVAGVEQADSWATDAHKWLNVPYDSGVALVRNPARLERAMAISAAYLPSGSEERNPADFTPELSRRARGVEVWAALRHLGRDGVAAMIEECCRHARRFAEGLGNAGYTILNEVALNQVLVSFGDAGRTEQVIREIQADGTCWCGRTEWQGHTAMRISVCSWATTDEDVERSLATMLRIAGRQGGRN